MSDLCLHNWYYSQLYHRGRPTHGNNILIKLQNQLRKAFICRYGHLYTIVVTSFKILVFCDCFATASSDMSYAQTTPKRLPNDVRTMPKRRPNDVQTTAQTIAQTTAQTSAQPVKITVQSGKLWAATQSRLYQEKHSILRLGGRLGVVWASIGRHI